MTGNINNFSPVPPPATKRSSTDTPPVTIGGRVFKRVSSDPSISTQTDKTNAAASIRRSSSAGDVHNVEYLPGTNPPPARPSADAAITFPTQSIPVDQAPFPGSHPPPPRASEETATTFPHGSVRSRTKGGENNPPQEENMPLVPPPSPAPKTASRSSTPPPSASASTLAPRTPTARSQTVGPRILNPDLLATSSPSPSASSSTASFSRRSNSAGSAQLSPSSSSTARPRSRTVGERTGTGKEPVTFIVNPVGPFSTQRLIESSNASSPPRSPRHSLVQRASASLSSMMPRSLSRHSSISSTRPDDFITPPDLNDSPFALPATGTITGDFFNHRTRTGKHVSIADMSYQEAHLLGGGGSSKAYTLQINEEPKVAIINTTMAGFFTRSDLEKAIIPYRTMYYDFFRYLRDSVVRCEGIGGVPDAQDPESFRLTFVMEKLEPLHLDNPESLARELIKISDKMKKFGVMHRDVKPDNLLLRGSPEKPQTLVLIDLFDTGTTRDYLKRIETEKELAEHLGNHLAVSPLYSHPEYPTRSEEFNRRYLADPGAISKENRPHVINDYISRELANQEVQVAITIWSFFLGEVPSLEKSSVANLSLMREKWEEVTCEHSIKEFVRTRLNDTFLTLTLGAKHHE